MAGLDKIVQFLVQENAQVNIQVATNGTQGSLATRLNDNCPTFWFESHFLIGRMGEECFHHKFHFISRILKDEVQYTFQYLAVILFLPNFC